jgi:hypothetical protein
VGYLDTSLDEDTRALAQNKTQAVAEGLARAKVRPYSSLYVG